MPRKPSPSLCPICLVEFPTPKDRGAHLTAEHGATIAWSGRTATVTDRDGKVTTLDMRDFRTLRERARSSGAGGSTPPPTGSAGQGEPPSGTDAPPAAGDASGSTGSTEPPAAPPGPRVGRQVMRPPSDPIARGVSRGSVEEAFTVAMLADMIRQGSRVLSDWDGAGERGTFSAIESTQLATLLYDQTVDVIVRRFGGNVGRFKAGIAVIIIVAGKGRVHAAAYAERQRRIAAGLPPVEPAKTEPAVMPAPATIPVATVAPAAPDNRSNGSVPVIPVMTAPRPAVYSPAAHTPTGPMTDPGFVPLTPAAIAERQRAWAASQADDEGTAATRRALSAAPVSALEQLGLGQS